MKFAKVRDVKSPCRGTSKSAGIDFFVPNYSEDFIKEMKEKNKKIVIDNNGIIIKPHEQILILSGIKVEIDEDFVLIAFNKSGIFVNMNLSVGACVIDSDYQGEICLSLINVSNDHVKIMFGQKIIQFILLPVNLINFDEVNVGNLYRNNESDRKDGGFGSTGIQ